jgi:hypothetical protein
MDIRRYLSNEPVVARPPSRLYRLQKLVQRNKVVYACGLVVALTLISGLGVSTSFFFKERQARVEAEQARANEMLLRKEAEAREKITEAGVLLNHNAMEEADALVDSIPVNMLAPSQEATDVFRSLGNWNLYQRKWKQAANRYIVLLQVNQVDKSDRTDQATSDLLVAAPILIEAGDITDYDRIRRAALDRLGNTTSPTAAEQLIKTSLMMPADESLLKQLDPLRKVVADSLQSQTDNGNTLMDAWRAFALSMLDYRRGNFNATVNQLQTCSKYPAQSPACIASTHLLLSMAARQLGKIGEADTELAQGRMMVEDRFQKKLELGDDKTGKIQGWIEARVLLHEAEALTDVSSQLQPDSAE